MEENKDSKIVKTYASDMAQAIEDSRGALVKNIIHAEEMRNIEQHRRSPAVIKGKIFLVLGILFFISALVGLGYLVMSQEKQGGVVATIATPQRMLIFNDSRTLIEVKDLEKVNIVDLILEAGNNTQVKPGDIEGVYLTLDQKTVKLRQFLELLESNLILGSTEQVAEDYMLGFLNEGAKPGEPGHRDLFLLLEMRSLPDIFGIMREWEAKMVADLAALFQIETSGEGSYLLTKSFEDGVVNNKNARILYNDAGNMVLMYVFIDSMHLIIANDVDAVREVTARVAGSSKTK